VDAAIRGQGGWLLACVFPLLISGCRQIPLQTRDLDDEARLQAVLGLSVSVSIARVFDPATGREWERVGIVPDIATAADDALAAALEHARRR
jgi:hypothetical protein